MRSHASRETSVGALDDLRLAPEPFLVLGQSVSGGVQLDATSPFLAATQLRNGMIAVTDRNSIDIFSGRGILIRRIGSNASSQWRFQQLARICEIPGNRLIAFDYATGRRTIWSLSGRMLDSSFAGRDMATQPCIGDGTLVVQSERADAASRPGFTAYDRVTLNGRMLRRVAWTPADTYRPRVRETLVVASKHHVYVWDGDPATIRAYSLDTGHATNISLDKATATVSPARRLIVDGAGRLWLNPGSGVWTILGRHGRQLGHIDISRVPGCNGRLASLTNDAAVIRCSRDKVVWLAFFRILPAQ